MPLLPSQPFHSSSARLAVACPSPTPSQPRGAASTGGLGTGPWPSGFAHIRRSRSRASASFPSPGTQGVAVKVSGPAGANTTLAAPCPRAPAQCALSRPGTGSAHHATWSPTHLVWTWLRPRQPNPEGEENPQGVGRIGSRDAHTGSRLPSPRPRADASRRTPAPRSGQPGRRGSAGRGAADSYGRLGGAVSPARCPRADRAHPGPLTAGDTLPAWLWHQAELCS